MYLLRSLAVIAATATIALSSFKNDATLTVTSSSFESNGNIPLKYSCEGDKVNPPLQVSGAPATTKTFALILHDPDAQRPGGFTHWVMWNIPADGTIAENYKGADQGLNGANQPGYIGMCPPTGAHHYHFMVYALDTQLQLDKTTTNQAALEKAMEGHIVAQGDLVGMYQKKGK